MTTGNLARMAGALLAGLLVAAACLCLLFAHPHMSADLQSCWAFVQPRLAYGAPLAVLTTLAVEITRLRQLPLQVVLSLAVTLLTAVLLVRTETLGAPAFAHDAWHAFGLAIVAIMSALVYWLLWGRRAGWRGNRIERAELTAAKAFEKAGAGAEVEPCHACLAAWSGLVCLTLMLFVWLSVSLNDLDTRLITDVDDAANESLKRSGHDWARFRVEAERGILSGFAPGPEELTAADAEVRRVLGPVTGIPGVLASIDNQAAVRADQTKAAPPTPQPIPETSSHKPVAESESGDAAGAGGATPRLADMEQAGPPADGANVETVIKSPAQVPVRGPDENLEAGEDTSNQAALDETDEDPPPCKSEHLATIKSSVILFENQRFDIASSYAGEFERLAASALACAPWVVLISGSADAVEDNVFNESLAWQRAAAARHNLIVRGVPSGLVVAEPMRTAAPTGKATSVAALNRRAEFDLVKPSELSRDATQDPEERAQNCESDLSEVMTKSTIYFATGSARVGAESMDLIKELALAIQQCGSVIVTIEGHTDRMGSASQNQQLSELRSSSVRELLLEAGVDQTRVRTKGFASDQPHRPGNTAEAYALNRRIEFRVSGKFTSGPTGGP